MTRDGFDRLQAGNTATATTAAAITEATRRGLMQRRYRFGRSPSTRQEGDIAVEPGGVIFFSSRRATMRWAILIFFLVSVAVPRTARAQGNPLGPEFRVNTYTTFNQRYPRVAADTTGNFVVVWASRYQDGWFSGVFGQRYASSGTALGAEFAINTYTTADQSNPVAAADGNGNFVVVWWSAAQDGSQSGVFGQRYAGGGSALGGEFRVNTYTTASQIAPEVAANAPGDFVVVWESSYQDGSFTGIFGQRYAASGAPAGPEFRVNTYTTSNQFEPGIASDAAGAFVVVWTSGQDGSNSGVFGQRYATSGAALGPEFRVNTYTTGAQQAPAVASDGAGNFVVVWMSNTQGQFWDVFGQRYAASGVPLGPEFRVNSVTSGDQVDPSIAADSSGNFVIVWGGTGYQIFGQRYASSGAATGLEFRVNTAPYILRHPAVATDALGDFVAVWDSDLQDGSGLGVFGQRYSQIVPVELMHFRVE